MAGIGGIFHKCENIGAKNSKTNIIL